MESETLEEQAERLANKIIEGEQNQISFHRDDEPSSELQQLIVKNLLEHGYKAEFHRFANDSLSISLSKIQDNEQDRLDDIDTW